MVTPGVPRAVGCKLIVCLHKRFDLRPQRDEDRGRDVVVVEPLVRKLANILEPYISSSKVVLELLYTYHYRRVTCCVDLSKLQ